MTRPSIRNPYLEDLNRLPGSLRRELGKLLLSLLATNRALGGSPESQPAGDAEDLAEWLLQADHDAGLRFASDDPTASRPEEADDPGLAEPAADASPDELLDVIRSFLAVGRVPEARRLAIEAAARFPDHEPVQVARRILDSDGKPVLRPGQGVGTKAEFDWLRNPPSWARGQWVALAGAKAVAWARTLPELVERLGTLNLPKKPLVHRVD